MTIQCPHCQHGLGFKEMKAGRFTPRCPKCQKKFSLRIDDDPEVSPVVAVLRSEPVLPEVTLPGPAAPATETLPVEATLGSAGAPAEAGRSETVGSGGSESGTTQGVPSFLGGCQILKLLGRGGTGAVYLARQVSVQRLIALRVMRPEWASNPTFVSRFTRDAYAAAQIRHHNLVQIHDFGDDRGTNYVSMEYVPGRSLAELVKQQKRLDPEVAVGYVLQAARGLKCAHDQGLIHRDIKPGNLLLSDQGVVKVVDLGLVKTPSFAEVEAAVDTGVTTVTRSSAKSLVAEGGPITLVNAAMGTPAFMAPEQARDALSVDARADIYSLGCSLYMLVTGKPPFEGPTAIELFSKHQNEPMVPVDAIARRVPKGLSDIILKMTAKRPEDRYVNLGELIKVLENTLGLPGSGVFSPHEEHANLLAESAQAFNAAPTARLRTLILLSASGGWAALVVLFALLRQPVLAGGLLGLGVMAALAYFVVNGLRRHSYLFGKVSEFLVGGSVVDWSVSIVVLLLFLTLLYVFHWFWGWMFFGIVAALAAILLHWKVDQRLDAERVEPLEKVRAMLRTLRLNGVDEEALRQFVATHAGHQWEEFYEALFGYESMLDARRRWGASERRLRRPRYAIWRDPLIAWIDSKQRARRAARETKLFQKIEEKSLESQGVNLLTARRKAQRMAEAMVAVAFERQSASRHFAAAAASTPRPIGRALHEAASKPEAVLVERETGLIGTRSPSWLVAIVGPKPRFLAGAILMAGFLAWVHQNEIITREQLLALKEATTKAAESGDIQALRDAKIEIKMDRPTQALKVDLPRSPANASRVLGLFNGFGPGVAALILLVSSFFGGVRVGIGAVAGAAVAWLGPALGLPAIGPLDPSWAAMVLGGTIAVAAIAFGRGR